MVLLQKITEGAIVENLKKRFMDDCIYVSFETLYRTHAFVLAGEGKSAGMPDVKFLWVLIVAVSVSKRAKHKIAQEPDTFFDEQSDIHRTSVDFCQPLQTAAHLHGQRGGHVPRSGEWISDYFHGYYLVGSYQSFVGCVDLLFGSVLEKSWDRIQSG